MDSLLKTQLIMLRCKRLDTLGSVVASVIEEELFHLISDFEEIADTGLDHNLSYDRYISCVAGRLLDANGVVRLTGNEHEYWQIVRCPTTAIKNYANEIESVVIEIMDDNHDALLEVSQKMIVDSVRVARTLPGLWVVEVAGALL